MKLHCKYFFFFLLTFILYACNNLYKGHVTESGFITVSDSKLYYETTGSGNAIILLHGGYLDRRMWESQVEEFSKKYRVITCDLRGHGATIDGDSSYFMYEAIKILLDSLHEKKVIMAGLSLGAMIATDFAIAYPQYLEKMLLITPGLNKLDTTFAEDSSISNYSTLLRNAVVDLKDTVLAAEYFIRSWFDGPYRLPAQTDTIARKKALSLVISTMKTHQFLHWTRFAEPPAIKRLKNIVTPTLIITAEKDNYRILKNAEALKNGIRGSKIFVIKNTAHLPNMEKPNDFNKVFLDFIKR